MRSLGGQTSCVFTWERVRAVCVCVCVMKQLLDGDRPRACLPGREYVLCGPVFGFDVRSERQTKTERDSNRQSQRDREREGERDRQRDREGGKKEKRRNMRALVFTELVSQDRCGEHKAKLSQRSSSQLQLSVRLSFSSSLYSLRCGGTRQIFTGRVVAREKVTSGDDPRCSRPSDETPTPPLGSLPTWLFVCVRFPICPGY